MKENEVILIKNKYLHKTYEVPINNVSSNRVKFMNEFNMELSKLYDKSYEYVYHELLELDNLLEAKVIDYMRTRRHKTTNKLIYSSYCDYNKTDKPEIYKCNSRETLNRMLYYYKRYVKLIFDRYLMDTLIIDKTRVYLNDRDYIYVDSDKASEYVVSEEYFMEVDLNE